VRHAFVSPINRIAHRVTGGKYDPAVRPLAEHFKQAPADEDPRVWLASEEGQAAMTYSKYSAFQVFGTRLVCNPLPRHYCSRFLLLKKVEVGATKIFLPFLPMSTYTLCQLPMSSLSCFIGAQPPMSKLTCVEHAGVNILSCQIA
jgi:hypothetical protein